MKKVKYSVSVFMLFLVLILNCELYQNYFQMYTEQFYYFDVIEENDREGLFETVNNIADAQGVAFFCAEYSTESVFSSFVRVYANTETKKILEREYYINEGNHNSFFSGSTCVKYYDFREGADAFEDVRFYFIGDVEQIREIRNTVHEIYGGGYIHKEENRGLEWLIGIVWGVTFGLLLILTWGDIQFNKKETFIKISVGASAEKLVVYNILKDILFYLSLFYILRWFIGKYVSLEYAKTICVQLLAIFLIANTLLHLRGLRYNYKEVLYGANISLKTIGNSYILKAVSMMVTIITLSVAINLISDNLKYFNMYYEIENYKDYAFVYIEEHILQEETQEENNPSGQIFYEYYKQGKVALSVYNTVNSDGLKYFLVNKNTQGIKKLIDEKSIEKSGYYILIPNGTANSQELAEDAYMITCGKFEGFIEEQTYTIIYYDEFELLYFDTSAGSKLSFGFEKQSNPIMIYCAFEKENVNEKARVCDILNLTQQDIMFSVDKSEVQHIIQKYNLNDMSAMSVVERCEQYRDSMLRVILLNSVMFLFMLFIEVIIIDAIIRMEYMVKAKELAIKTMLGYSMWQKNKQLFILNIIAAIIATMAMIISSFMFDISTWYFTLIASGVVMAIESALIYYHIVRVEKSSIPKVLKGGSL